MTCTTFLHDGELNQPLPDAEVQHFLDAVRKLSGENWQVVPLHLTRHRWLRKPVTETLYGLYVYIGGVGPWQQINLYREGSASSINLYATLDVVAAYLLGMYGGLAKAHAKAMKENQ
jgi:hypothetical protein